jgi:hypothetical protein
LDDTLSGTEGCLVPSRLIHAANPLNLREIGISCRERERERADLEISRQFAKILLDYEPRQSVKNDGRFGIIVARNMGYNFTED